MFISISSRAMPQLRKMYQTRPGCRWVSREKKLDQESEPEYALVELIFTWETMTKSPASGSAAAPNHGRSDSTYGAIGSRARVLPTTPRALKASSAPPSCLSAPITTQPGPAASTARSQRRALAAVRCGMKRR